MLFQHATFSGHFSAVFFLVFREDPLPELSMLGHATFIEVIGTSAIFCAHVTSFSYGCHVAGSCLAYVFSYIVHFSGPLKGVPFR